MSQFGKWQKALGAKYGVEKARQVMGRVRARYDRLLADAPSVKDRARRAELRQRILPGLALYQTLLEEYGEQARALAEIEALFKATFFNVQVRGIRLLNRLLPDPFPLVRAALRPMMVSSSLPGALEIVADTPDRFAANVHRCLFLDTLTAYGAPELTALYCNTDDWLAAEMPKIRWERTQTLGRGGQVCDFGWSRSREK